MQANITTMQALIEAMQANITTMQAFIEAMQANKIAKSHKPYYSRLSELVDFMVIMRPFPVSC